MGAPSDNRSPSWPELPRSLPNLSSIQGRYLYSVLLLCLTLGIAATAGHLSVQTASSQAVEKINDRAQISGAVEDMLRQLATAQKHIGRFILQPEEASRENLRQSLNLIHMSLGRLWESKWEAKRHSIRDLLRMLERDHMELRTAAERLIATRLDVNRWFPASVIMENQLLPSHAAFTASIDNVVDDLEHYQGRQGDELSAPYRNLVRLRHYWSRMTSEFRLYVANRLGVFSVDPLQGMASRASNIRMYSGSVVSLLQQLQNQTAVMAKQGIMTDGLIEALRAHHDIWISGYKRIVDNVHRDGWRSDLVQLNQTIDPLIDALRQRLSTLELELDVESAQDISLLTDAARQLSHFILLLAVIGSSIFLLSYSLFSRAMLRPLRELTKALKAVAEGEEQHAPLPGARLAETRDLLHSFQRMHEQVRERQRHLDHLAHHDMLTGLPNRLLFRDRLEHSLKMAVRCNVKVALLYLDLDRFKQVNDTLGHLIGDKLLVEVAKRLRGSLRESDTVARLSGDEFAVLMENIEDREEVTVVAEKLLQALSLPYRLDDETLHVTASIGIALGPDDDTEVTALLRDADAAMYEAKRQGRTGYRYFTRDITDRAMALLQLERQLRDALEGDRFQLLLQPIGTLDGTRIHACEALLRWQTEDETWVTPDHFLPVLEETGLIIDVTERMLEHVSDIQHILRTEGLGEIPIAINLSSKSLGSAYLINHLMDLLQRGAINADQLLLEITEDTLVHDAAANERALRRLKALGVSIALDDFGTGHSSLNHLRRFPFDMLKIDQEFVRNVPHDANDGILVQAIIALAHSFGMQVSAEGVESSAQMDFLRRHGCDFIQGYYLSQPLQTEQLVVLLQRYESRLADRKAATLPGLPGTRVQHPRHTQ